MKWIECQSCWAEFRVVSDIDQSPEYCPFCSEPIPEQEDEDLDEDE